MAIRRAKDADGKPLFDESGRPVWEIDIRVSQGEGRPKRRLRSRDFRSRDEAERAVTAIRASERAKKFGFLPAKHRPKLQRLIADRLPAITPKNEQTRARRVLYSWLRLMDPMLTLDDRYHPVNGYQSPITIESVETPAIRKYVELRTEQGQSPSSIDRELNIICATLNAAPDFFPELRQWMPPKIPRPKVPKTRRERLITDAEYNAILATLQAKPQPEELPSRYQARQRFALILQFALQTGMRPKEIWRLRWADIDEDHRRIRVKGTKTENRGNSMRYLPLTSQLEKVIAARRATTESSEFVWSLTGSPRYTDYDCLKAACEANGIPYGRSIENGLELYCARHTFTTKLLLAGATLPETGAVTGHSDRELILHYGHLVAESEDRTRGKLEEIERVRLSKK